MDETGAEHLSESSAAIAASCMPDWAADHDVLRHADPIDALDVVPQGHAISNTARPGR
jgi:hypothetical protein